MNATHGRPWLEPLAGRLVDRHRLELAALAAIVRGSCLPVFLFSPDHERPAPMPAVRKITATAGRTAPHPLENFANLRADVTLEAELLPGEDPAREADRLTMQAAGLVDRHLATLAHDLKLAHELRHEADQAATLRRNIEQAQATLERIEARRQPAGHQLGLFPLAEASPPPARRPADADGDGYDDDAPPADLADE